MRTGSPVAGQRSGWASRFGAIDTPGNDAGATVTFHPSTTTSAASPLKSLAAASISMVLRLARNQRDVVVAVEDGQNALAGFSAQLHVRHQRDALRWIVQRDPESALAICRLRSHVSHLRVSVTMGS